MDAAPSPSLAHVSALDVGDERRIAVYAQRSRQRRWAWRLAWRWVGVGARRTRPPRATAALTLTRGAAESRRWATRSLPVPDAVVRPRALPAPSSSRGPRRRVDSLGPPIGRVHSCFSRRNGTPRQGGDLVPSARCVLTLAPGLPVDLLAGLDQYSHVWIIYVFHANTNMGGDTRNGGGQGQGGGPSPRRRRGGRPRRPHAPSPTRSDSASAGRRRGPRRGNTTLGGADLVDGTPVLDVKPYVPFCDRVERAVAPAWVGREAADRDEPLAVTRVESAEGAEDAVATAYEASVKERRRRRLQREHASEEKGGAGTRTGRARDTREEKRRRRGVPAPNLGGERAEGAARGRRRSVTRRRRRVVVFSNPEAAKRAPEEAKARRQAGLEPPDALYPSGSAFVAFAREFWRWTCARFAAEGGAGAS